MPLRDMFKVIGTGVAVIFVLLGMSYWSELPKYRFEKAVAITAKKLVGARLVSSTKRHEPTSPISWFWPATTAWVFATPDLFMNDRFYTVSVTFEVKETNKLLVDVDCTHRTETVYDLNEPDTAAPALDPWGNPVMAPNGKTYRKTNVSVTPDPKQLQEFCNTDWSAEKRALADNARSGR